MMNRNWRFKDLTGKVFYRLTVLDLDRIENGSSYWKCECECGTQTIVNIKNLGRGTKSCGCLRREQSIGIRPANASHGMTGTPTHRAWINMRYRCFNERCADYFRYGGRGITICERWDSFEAFLEDMGERPSADLSLDRIDSNGNYEPENCRWADKSTQSSNKRPSRKRFTVDETWYEPNTNNGYCMCGCGELAPIAVQSSKSKRTIVDQPKQFLNGHNKKKKIK